MQGVSFETRPIALRALAVGAVAALCWTASSMLSAAEIDLTTAVVVVPKKTEGPQAQAVRMLLEEVQKRSQITWSAGEAWPSSSTPAIVVGLSMPVETAIKEHGIKDVETPEFKGAEGYRVRVFGGAQPIVMIAGNDTRGVLFGVGRLLRELRLSKGHAGLREQLNIATAPKYPLRGHQLGYRPKTNSYDAWSVPMWEQYIRDLAIFGTNAIELLPPRTDDAADSPHFPLPQMQMMIEMSRLCDQYGLDVWIWYPAMDANYSDPATVSAALDEWANVIKQLPRVDAVFVPGGDPGDTDPRILLPFLEKQMASLRRFHPKLQMWVSPQSFNQEWLDAFNNYLKEKQPDWLSGVVYGPQVRVSLPQLRADIPKKYPIRRYPDITHSIQCQYSVPQWDIAYAATESREVINPRPVDESVIFHGLADQAIGFITYSEGCNDDVNKIVWSSLGWDPKMPLIEILRQFSRYFIDEKYADDFAHGLLSLEQNWRPPLLTNSNVMTTLQQFQDMERTVSPATLLNWRFQQALYRAYYDAYIYQRLHYETSLVNQALVKLAVANRSNVSAKIKEAENLLEGATSNPPAPELRARVFELGDMLFQSIRMQLSVERHKAIAPDRGATLDTIDRRISNLQWVASRLAEIRKLSSDAERLRELHALVHWTDPGPGGFYDDLGNVARQPHLVRGVGFEKDPGMYQTPRVAFGGGGRFARAAINPISWSDSMEMLYDGPLKMHYNNLDREASYAVRIAYGPYASRLKIRCMADDRYVVHSETADLRTASPATIPQFDVPVEATRDGQLTLTWYRQKGRGDAGAGNGVAEIWLIKKPATGTAGRRSEAPATRRRPR